MSDIVVDSCVATKWVLIEPDSPKANRILADADQSGDQLIGLDLVLPEVTNAIWKRYHRGLLTIDEARNCLGVLLRTPLRLQPTGPLLAAALEIAARYRCAVYDAAFVALSRHRGLKGVTADVPLYNAVHGDFPEILLLRDW